MKNSKFAVIMSILVLAAVAVFSLPAQAPSQAATFLPMAAGHLVKVIGYNAGSPVLGQSSVVESATGTSYSVLKGTLTTSAATSNAVTITGVSSTSNCVISATNASGATNIATTYVSGVAANTVTVTHTATASMTYNLHCTAS